MYKPILKAFRSLPYIVYNSHYLIPQPPFPKNLLTIKHIQKDPWKVIQISNPQLVDESILALSQKENQEQLKSFVETLYLKQKQAYSKVVKTYMEEYIKPLGRLNGIRPQFLYYHDHKEMYANLIGKRSLFLKQINKGYSDLSNQEKQKYIQKCQQKLNQHLKQLGQAQSKYRIPARTYAHCHILYLRDMNIPISKDSVGLFSKLPFELKKKYRQQAKKLIINDKKILQQFLAKRQLSLEFFQYIQTICQKMKEVKKGLKEQKRNKSILKKAIKLQSTNTTQISIEEKEVFSKKENIKQKTTNYSQNDSQVEQWKNQIKFQNQLWINQDLYLSDEQKVVESDQIKQILNQFIKQKKIL